MFGLFKKKSNSIPEWTDEVLHIHSETKASVLNQVSDFIGKNVESVPQFSKEDDLIVASYLFGFMSGMFQESGADEKMAGGRADVAELINVISLNVVLLQVMGDPRAAIAAQNLPQINGQLPDEALGFMEKRGGEDGIRHWRGEEKQFGGSLAHYLKHNT